MRKTLRKHATVWLSPDVHGRSGTSPRRIAIRIETRAFPLTVSPIHHPPGAPKHCTRAVFQAPTPGPRGLKFSGSVPPLSPVDLADPAAAADLVATSSSNRRGGPVDGRHWGPSGWAGLAAIRGTWHRFHARAAECAIPQQGRCYGLWSTTGGSRHDIPPHVGTWCA